MTRRRRNAISAKYVPYLFIAFGLLFCVLAVAFAINPIHLLRNGTGAEATVTDLVLNDSGNYAPVLQFQLPAGELVTVQSSMSSNPPKFRAGDQVEILYDPELPENVVIHSWVNLWLLSIATGFFGLFFGGVGLASLLSVRRQRRVHPEKMVSLQKQISPRLIPYAFLGFGIFWFLIAGLIATSQMRFNERALITEGRVVRMAQTDDNTVSPIVRFRLPNEETVEFRSSTASSNPRYRVEDEVQVRYDPEDPYNAQIVGGMGAWVAVLIMALFGAIFSAIGIVTLFTNK